MNVVVDITENYFILENFQYTQINRRLKTSLKRLNVITHDNKIEIPYESLKKELVLTEILKLLKKFDIEHELSKNIKEELDSFSNELENFKLFSTKAKQIRNDEFKENDELVLEFDKFQKSLQKNMVRTLYDFQILSSFHLAFSQYACNFAVPGAGKTSIVYGAYAYLKNLPKDDSKYVDKIMVIGPLSSFAPWENEYESCFGKKPITQRISGEVKKELRVQHLYSGNPAELTIISHAGVNSLEKEIKDFLKNNRTMLVVDEAHRIKNPEGIWANSILEISKEAKARVILTGTPLPNGYQDLFNLYKFIYPFKYKSILNKHLSNLEDMSKNDSIESSRVKQFIEDISPYFIRIKKSDLKLPPLTEKTIEVDMDSEQRKIYDFIETKYVKSFQVDASGTAKDILNKAKLIRLRQASINPALLMKPLEDCMEFGDGLLDRDPNSDYVKYNEYIDDSEVIKIVNSFEKLLIPSKFQKTKELLDEIFERKEKVIIWTIFIQNAKMLQQYLVDNKIQSKLLIGEVPQEEREDIIAKFNNPDDNDFNVVIANPFSVSESISLHKGCRNAIYIERDYNCAMFLQSKDRIHRVGLKEGQITNYYYIVSKNSVDSVINRKLNEKAERMSKVIDDDIPLLARLHDDDETDIIKALLEDYAKRT